jgi:glycosidase
MQRLIERGIPDSAYRRAEKLEKLALTLQFSVPGVPSIYYGDELGMTGVNDPSTGARWRKPRAFTHSGCCRICAS